MSYGTNTTATDTYKRTTIAELAAEVRTLKRVIARLRQDSRLGALMDTPRTVNVPYAGRDLNGDMRMRPCTRQMTLEEEDAANAK